jgi:hypothetical protein
VKIDILLTQPVPNLIEAQLREPYAVHRRACFAGLLLPIAVAY